MRRRAEDSEDSSDDLDVAGAPDAVGAMFDELMGGARPSPPRPPPTSDDADMAALLQGTAPLLVPAPRKPVAVFEEEIARAPEIRAPAPAPPAPATVQKLPKRDTPVMPYDCAPGAATEMPARPPMPPGMPPGYPAAPAFRPVPPMPMAFPPMPLVPVPLPLPPPPAGGAVVLHGTANDGAPVAGMPESYIPPAPGALPSKPDGMYPPHFTPIAKLLAGFKEMLPPGVPLPSGLEDSLTGKNEKKKPKKKKPRQIGDWVEFHDEDGACYYQNVATNETTWDPPTVFGGSQWVEYKTDDGEAYYCNTDTKETVWEKPEDMLMKEREVKPSFIKDIEANEKKRLRSEKAKEQAADAKAPAVGQTMTFELPLTEAEIRAKNKRDRERREKVRQERERRGGSSLAFLTPEEREREARKAARLEQKAQREEDMLQRLKEQAERRKEREKGKKEKPPAVVDADGSVSSGDVIDLDAMSDE